MRANAAATGYSSTFNFYDETILYATCACASQTTRGLILRGLRLASLRTESQANRGDAFVVVVKVKV